MNLYQEGNSHYHAKEFEKAIPYYTRFIEATDEPAIMKQGLINRGLAFTRMKVYDKAISDFTHAIQIDSTDMASFVDRGLAFFQAQRFEEATTDFQYVVASNSNRKMSENSLYWLALISYQQGNPDLSIAYCNQFLDLNSSDVEVLFLRALAYGLTGNLEQAIKDYTLILKNYPNAYQAYANRGVAKINLLTTRGNLKPSKKETKSACKDLAKAKELGDNSVEDMLYIYCENGN
ncbi:tetratricopeptide repeat protein [Robiginitalea sp. M366]|uniref:tetratricopeptide repeat protein n=1 Tax=Robiginitalea aestuariiviva TaxID=3036903 RepID=UPI00240DFE81|nr:tetratricopeptide repeat protein [Robiginitalea aestuariiviva]MDG1573424.1 tetratricopeptide repeat protein [Robiginitalea aestuariiviva]